MNRPKVLGVILAGGQARRMGGGDKVLLELAGESLLQHVIERFASQVDKLILSANGDPARFEAFDLPIVADAIPNQVGPLAGLLAAMEFATEAQAGFSHVAMAPGDSPFLPLDLVKRLLDTGQSGPAIAASGDHSHPVFGVFPIGAAGALRIFLELGQRKMGAFAKASDAVEVDFKTEPLDLFMNINTPDDLATAEQLIQNGAINKDCAL